MSRYYVFAAILVIFCVGILVLGFSLVGSPISQQAIQLDSNRLTAFGDIQEAVQSYVQTNNTLPEKLNSLNLSISDLNDPQTNQPYDYAIVSQDSYKVCTTFSTDGSQAGSGTIYNSSPVDPYGGNQKHKKGYDCITYNVPDYYFSTPTPFDSTPSPIATISAAPPVVRIPTTPGYPDFPVADKPVIYLYPSQKEQVSVRLQFAGKLTNTYPLIDSQTDSWNVIAYPDGHIINTADNQEYSYLFWEGTSNYTYDLSTGFVVKGSDTASFLQKQLAQMGLTPKEYNEFIVYWLPKMQHNPYNLIHFAGTEYTNQAKLTITPQPDSLLRVFMVFTPLQNSHSLPPQTFPLFHRTGFTVVEWGGTEE